MGARSARVIIASTRASAGCTTTGVGRSSPNGLGSGVSLADPEVVADGEPVGEALRAAVGDGVDVIITSGGTGISPSDTTPTRRWRCSTT